jgi:hypothetical protein
MSASWLDLLPAGLVHNLDAIAFASDPSGVALECAKLDPERLRLYALLAEEVIRRRESVQRDFADLPAMVPIART